MIFAMFFCYGAGIPCEFKEGPFMSAAACEATREKFSGNSPELHRWYKCKGRPTALWEDVE
jgi:hypothetical protein